MQSLNEELSTVNVELQAKVEELSRATDDMQNLLNSTQVATVFLDNNLDLKRYTEQARELINLIPTDVGRPLSDVTAKFEHPRLMDDCREVLRTLVRKEIELRDRDGAWFLLRIMPYRTGQNVIDGVVLTFVEINRLKRAEQQAADVCECFAEIVDTAREPMALLDAQLRIMAVNGAFCRAFGAAAEHAAGQPIDELAQAPWNNPQLRGLLGNVAERRAEVRDFALDRTLSAGRRRLLLNARRLHRDAPGAAGVIVVSISDQGEGP
jgi:two-component system, chemotaxis family, CheB/CheR fusion protein